VANAVGVNAKVTSKTLNAAVKSFLISMLIPPLIFISNKQDKSKEAFVTE
jgi:hypothetical protein